MKILITGAHFTPAIAVINELKKISNVEIVYVGRKTTLEGDRTQSVESQELPKFGVRFIPIITGRFSRTFSIYTILSLLKIPIGLIQSFYILLKERPDIILSFGGYVSVPLVIIGWLWSIPIIVHEQTLVSGLANELSAIFADKICISFNNTKVSNTNKVVLTGNPLREEIFHPQGELDEDFQNLFKEAEKNKLPVIFVTGGNQGSHIINVNVEKILGKILAKACVVHQTGDSKYKDYDRLSLVKNKRYVVRKWVGLEIGKVLKKTDLVISRAGANTLTEITYLGIPALVIPLPYLYKNEQFKNAEFFQQFGFVEILKQSRLNDENLLESINKMLIDLDRYKDSATKENQIVIPHAAKRLALETLLLVH